MTRMHADHSHALQLLNLTEMPPTVKALEDHADMLLQNAPEGMDAAPIHTAVHELRSALYLMSDGLLAGAPLQRRRAGEGSSQDSL